MSTATSEVSTDVTDVNLEWLTQPTTIGLGLVLLLLTLLTGMVIGLMVQVARVDAKLKVIIFFILLLLLLSFFEYIFMFLFCLSALVESNKNRRRHPNSRCCCHHPTTTTTTNSSWIQKIVQETGPPTSTPCSKGSNIVFRRGRWNYLRRA